MKPAEYRVKPALVWPGGKSRFADKLLPLIPKHRCYVEPFAVGIAILLAKPRSQIEVINDLNGDLVRFYRCVRFHPDALLTELEFVLNSREEFSDFRIQHGLTDIQRSARWWFRNRNGFRGGSLDTFGTGPTSGSASGSREDRMNQIRELSVRLDRVTVENLPWERCVSLYDRSETFFFFDPPYTGCNAGVYQAWTSADVLRFRETLVTLKGKWLVTLNDSPKIRQIFAGCRISAVDRANKIGSRKGKRYRELIIAPPEAE